jgi:fumarylacetoacetase
MHINVTHDPQLKSWVISANDVTTDFPIQNLPMGVFAKKNGMDAVGIAIGDYVLDVTAASLAGLYDGLASDAAKRCGGATLHQLMALGPRYWSSLRAQTSRLLRSDTQHGRKAQKLAETLLMPMAETHLSRPIYVTDFTDFFASAHHALRVGGLLPNYKHVPIGYHGRASSLVMSGAPIYRPCGQTIANKDLVPNFAPSSQLDYEVEIGFYIGQKSDLGNMISLQNAENHLFGICLVNDWSARDIQKWESQPLGPFLGKSFATTLSPWVITLEALVPYRCARPAREADDPAPLPYLKSPENEASGGFDITVEAYLLSATMREQGASPMRLSKSNMRHLYWSPAQLLIHHTSNGCNMRIGDLFATGTISGPAPDERSCLLELTMGGTEPISLPTGEIRRFLDDGDEVIFRAYAQREGFARIGLGECRGVIHAPKMQYGAQ